MMTVLFAHSSQRDYLKLKDALTKEQVQLIHADATQTIAQIIDNFSGEIDVLVIDVPSVSSRMTFLSKMVEIGAIKSHYPEKRILFICDEDEMSEVSESATREGIASYGLIFNNSNFIINLKNQIKAMCSQ